MSGVAVLGGAGFIGSNLVDALLMAGHDVTVLDNFSEGKRENLVGARQIAESLGRTLDVVRGDIRDLDTVTRIVDHKFCVFHLAAMSRIQPSITDPILAWSQNIVGTGNVLEACRQGEVRRVVYSASSSAYGELNSPPMVETMPTDCLNPYSLSKKVGEEMVEMYRKLYGLSTVSLRYFNVYGPRHQEDGDYATVIAIFRRQRRYGKKLTVVGDGEQRRDFTFVGDVVRANMLAMMDLETHGTFNVGTGRNYSINEVAALVGGDVEHVPSRPAEARLTLADVRKIGDRLGWRPTVSLEQGLLTLDDYERRNATIVVPGR